MMIKRSLIALSCLALLAGCGGGGGGESAADVANDYVKAQSQGDFGRVCELFSDQLRQQLGGSNCVRFLQEQSSGIARRQLDVASVNENGDQATVKLRTAGESGGGVNLQISLARQNGDWRVTSIGGAGGAK
jgi:hypothetical protein